MKIKKGVKITAKSNCLMEDDNIDALIVGKSYTITSTNPNEFTIDSEYSKNHSFLKSEISTYFSFNSEFKHDKKYMIFIEGRNTPTKQHTSLEEAEKEAMRIVEQNLLSQSQYHEQNVYVVSVIKKYHGKKEIVFRETSY